MRYFFVLYILLLFGCVTYSWRAPEEFMYVPIETSYFNIATWQKITDNSSDIHIYIEGDGRAFDSAGRPTHDPTPRGKTLRNIAFLDSSPNVVYMARPCQFIGSYSCNQKYWTTGRFSFEVIEAMSDAVKKIAKKRNIILIGYSGGGLVSGLIIEKNLEINIKKWITIAGVLNHSDWTDYFGDSNLTESINMKVLPKIPQVHYAAEKDKTVPIELTKKWVDINDLKIIQNATHDDLGTLKLDFSY